MAAVAMNGDHKKKLPHFADHDPRDGMSASTKRHFDHVKRKMLAFVDRQHRRKKVDRGMQLPPPMPFRHNAPPPPPHIFADQNRAPRQFARHPTPLVLHKQQGHFPGHTPPHKQLAGHHGFATPQIPQRLGTPGLNGDGRLHANAAFF